MTKVETLEKPAGFCSCSVPGSRGLAGVGGPAVHFRRGRRGPGPDRADQRLRRTDRARDRLLSRGLAQLWRVRAAKGSPPCRADSEGGREAAALLDLLRW